jgi:hypothetical protein
VAPHDGVLCEAPELTAATAVARLSPSPTLAKYDEAPNWMALKEVREVAAKQKT